MTTRTPSALAVALVALLLVSPLHAAAGDGHDRAAELAAIADDVLRGASEEDVPAVESVAPEGLAPASAAEEQETEVELPVAAVPPAQEGTFVATPRGAVSPAKQDYVTAPPPYDYESNSWRQPPQARHGLSFSSGVLARRSGLDPALRHHAAGPALRGRRLVYGFLRLRVPLDETVERRLADLGVTLLGPHDDHHKARLPVASLEQIAKLPEVEWVGVSSRKQKRSRELSALRRSRGATSRATPLPIVINLFDDDQDGTFQRALEAAGVSVGTYDADLRFYRAVADERTIDDVTTLDFVLFVELIEPLGDHHDQSTPLIDADMVRPGTPLGLTRFSGHSTLVGILDSGFMMGPYSSPMHGDLSKYACGKNFTDEAGTAFNDPNGHGTHVIGTIAGTGSVDPRYKGVAPGVGSYEQIRAAKVTKADRQGLSSWAEAAMDFMSSFSECTSAPPEVINMSNGVPFEDTPFPGTDSLSRKLDDKVWTYGQAYVVSAGNEGPTPGSLGRPAVAKNALTVGSVFDRMYFGVGDVTSSSSRGPTADGRMKPNLVAPGNMIKSAQAGTVNMYTDKHGTSMAAPHVTGLAATLMEHYSDLKGRPALLRSHLMGTAIAHDDLAARSNDYGIGRVSGHIAHWTHPNSAGWQTSWIYGGVQGPGFAYGTVDVPPNTKRLVVVLTWDEPAASAGASRAVSYDLDLWADNTPYCTEEFGGCGEFASRSGVDNVEYLAVDNPPAGPYRLKVVPVSFPNFPLRYGVTAVVIRGDTTPAMGNQLTPPPGGATVGSIFEVRQTVTTPHYVAAGVQVTPTIIPAGVTLISIETQRHDGQFMAFPNNTDFLTLGNLFPNYSRQVRYYYRADTPGPKVFYVRAWSDNAGEVTANTVVQVRALTANLVPSALGTTPSAPAIAPGAQFSVTDTVLNAGEAASTSSRTRYYLSLDAVKGGDALLSTSHAVPALDPGESHTATVKVTVPANLALNDYFLLACADDQNAVEEGDEADNCAATLGAVVTVSRPDLVVSGVSNPPSSVARGGNLRITDTTQNLAAVAAKSSKTRYYLSRDTVKGAGDQLLGGSRGVAELAGGASRSGTAKLTVPKATALDTYFVLACADDAKAVTETDESNNCRASAATVTITP